MIWQCTGCLFGNAYDAAFMQTCLLHKRNVLQLVEAADGLPVALQGMTASLADSAATSALEVLFLTTP